MAEDGGLVLNWSFDVQAPTRRHKRPRAETHGKASKRLRQGHAAQAQGTRSPNNSQPRPKPQAQHKASTTTKQLQPPKEQQQQQQQRHRSEPAAAATEQNGAGTNTGGGKALPSTAVNSAAGVGAGRGMQGAKSLGQGARKGFVGKPNDGGAGQRVDKPKGVKRQRLDEMDLAAADSDEEDAVMALVAKVTSRDAEVEKHIKAYRRPEEDDSDSEGEGRDLDRLGTERVGHGDGVVEFDDEEVGERGGRMKAGSKWTVKKGEKGKKTGESKGRGAIVPAPGKLAHAGAAPEAAGQELFGDPDTFTGLGLSEALSSHLDDLNFTAPTRVQQASIPVLLRGKDALVQAPTGSGKTLCYVAPIVQQLAGLQPRLSRGEGTYAIVIAPTRELCMQINDVLLLVLRRFHWIVSGLLIGGENRQHEKARLRKGCTVLVASPGRLLDHLVNTGSFRCTELRWLVLDEADRLLDLGFEAKLKEIISHLEEKTGSEQRQYQTVLLSATLHSQLGQLASMSLVDPVAVGFTWKKGTDGKVVVSGEGADKQAQDKAKGTVMGPQDGVNDDDNGAGGGDGGDEVHESDSEAGAGSEERAVGAKGSEEREAASGEVKKYVLPKTLKQQYVEVPAKLRLAGLIAAVRSRLKKAAKGAGSAKLVVFLSSCDSVEFHHKVLHDVLPTLLNGPLVPSSCVVVKLHGDMAQSQRTASFLSFTTADTGVLLCTDVAARGLDFPSVTSIIQFDPPGEVSEYVHRVGRTARMGHGGDALLFLLPAESGYVGLLGQHGVELGQEGVGKLLSWVPLVAQAPDGNAPSFQRKGRGSPEAGFFAAAQQLHSKLLQTITSDSALSQLASDAFRSCIRSYTTHPTSVKKIFNIRLLHLGHMAHSFGLSQQPKMVGASGSKAERKKRRKEAAEKLVKKHKKAMRGKRTSQE